MYERFYNFRERPFALSPDPAYLFLSRGHGEALDSIRYGIESRAGFIVVTGEIGAGKTTLLQTILQRLDDRTVIARVVNTMLDARELLEAIALDFGLTDISKSKPALLRDLGLFLVEQRRQGRQPLLVIDEAQNLTAQALEEVRLLSNMETEKSKLLQILLAGQPNLRDTIASPELEQFRQRISVSYHLRPLDPEETAAYINFRLQHAALGEPLRFPPDACSLIHEVTGGVPRVINVLCDATLVFGYAEERRTIDRAMIDEVITELEETGVVRRPDAAAAAAATGAAAAMPVASATPSTSVVAPQASRHVDAPTVPASAAAAAHVPPSPSRPTTPETPRHPAAAVAAPPNQFEWTPPAAARAAGARADAATGTTAAGPVVSQTDTTGTTRNASQTATATRDNSSERDRSFTMVREAALQATEFAPIREQLEAEREGLARRQRDLAAREQAIAERERQIAEQRRILGEEYRLLRQTNSGRTAAPNPAASPTRSGIHPTASAPRDSTLWQRLSRLFTQGQAVRS